jgi:hypothetical protein
MSVVLVDVRHYSHFWCFENVFSFSSFVLRLLCAPLGVPLPSDIMRLVSLEGRSGHEHRLQDWCKFSTLIFPKIRPCAVIRATNLLLRVPATKCVTHQLPVFKRSFKLCCLNCYPAGIEAHKGSFVSLL